ncbi:hypothetical protein AQUCO_01900034v1 [Aquilegia coerulea]|uniref:Uncharacterized protein n=1 Tax=Aquilegia coerulea TaxID=218851 RepID=A0A2G5DIM7_AQUCA|nr:hypothetical protein AQUCO_01900034v1 [Aquilegia coerulea]
MADTIHGYLIARYSTYEEKSTRVTLCWRAAKEAVCGSIVILKPFFVQDLLEEVEEDFEFCHLYIWGVSQVPDEDTFIDNEQVDSATICFNELVELNNLFFFFFFFFILWLRGCQTYLSTM